MTEEQWHIARRGFVSAIVPMVIKVRSWKSSETRQSSMSTISTMSTIPCTIAAHRQNLKHFRSAVEIRNAEYRHLIACRLSVIYRFDRKQSNDYHLRQEMQERLSSKTSFGCGMMMIYIFISEYK
jgi:signal recognition particle receptor subunit beta